MKSLRKPKLIKKQTQVGAHCSQDGFTLLELAVVVVGVGILTALIIWFRV